ncbi:DNA processing protein [Sedimentibacter acidaminivorans]|jgi:DNA processing protein|uniref:DNA processing protein n=1 Tax=Sedimentibacter acidaminivorans TaxID=913099 RepID=A0ABS4G9R8_9FIRM|nr:DNA-processing protein DprA [Sedimentibacter acidaminivorans]MBP1924150.1 DNA processing protein [Sedimentibacter acidaminivorans]
MVSNENIIRLQLVNGLGRKTISKILSYIDSQNMELNDFSSIVKLIKSLGVKKLKFDLEKIEEESSKIFELCRKSKINVVGIYDEEYPDKLRAIEDKPLILYVDGNLKILNDYNNIAIVGTRKPSQKGYEVSSILAERLAEEECCVVSGFATGCDEAAHRGCLSTKGKTIAVIPSGHHCIYPKGNKTLYNMILLNNGAIVSELPPNAKAEMHTFIERNRIIAALSEGIIVIEGGKKGGTSHTVRFANTYNKPVAYTSMADISTDFSQEKSVYQENIDIINSFDSLEKFKEKSFEKVLDKVYSM